MKRLIVLLITVAFIAIWSSPSSVFAKTVNKKYTLHLATQMPIKHTITKSANILAKRVAELSNGKINIVVHPGGSMYKDREIPEATMTGGCDIGISTANTWAKHARGMSFWEVPFLIPPSVSVDKLVDEAMLFFDKTLSKKGGKILGFAYYGYVEGLVTTKKQVKKPVDVKGQKLRIYDRTHLPGFKTFGAAPVVMSSKEVYIGLQRGVLDGALSGLSSIVSRKWMEVCDYVITIPNLVSAPSHPFPIVINRIVWDKMEPAVQKILLQAVKEASQFAKKDVNEKAIKNLNTLKSAMTVYEVKVGSLEWNEWKDALYGPGKEKFLKDNPKAGPQIIKIISSLN